jgi:transcriptional regulator with XRE-family HTH domain
VNGNSDRVAARATEQTKVRRRRGVVLTSTGLQRLQAAILAVEISENQGNRFTLEELGNRINVSTKTLSRLWSLNSGVDQKTLRLCFSAFGLELLKQDYTSISDVDEPDSAESASTQAKTPHLSQFGEAQTLRSQEIEPGLPYPDGPVPLHSPFYIERPPIEALAYQEVTQPGCVVRIRAPREMGKSSLMLRLLNFAETQSYRTVILDCNQFDSSYLTDLNKFLRGFCLRIARELGIDPRLDDYWDEEIGSKLSCTFYFKTYLLKQISCPVVLVLNEVDRFFEYPQFAQDFFPLLRSWYEEARRDVNFQKLRLVVVYSTEEYVALDINHSPFNVGLPLRLPEFTQQQVQDLAQRHGLNWNADQVIQLMSLVGGHPALIRIALYHVCSQGSLEQLLQEASINGGIFHYHLWRHWVILQKNSSLIDALATVVAAEQTVSLDPVQAYKLESQGLIRSQGDSFKPRCELYRIYFKQRLASFSNNL